jgi:hypothetical protein
LNPGSFALVQLYHVSDVAESTDFDETSTFRLPWVADPVEGGDGVTRMKRVNRGPIFSRDGSTRADWDSAFRVPIFVATLNEEYGMATEDVLSGRFLAEVRRWMIPIERRIKESAIERGVNLDSKANEVAGQMTDYLAYEANKPDATTVIQANKHCKEDMVKAENRLARSDTQLKDYYMPPEI